MMRVVVIVFWVFLLTLAAQGSDENSADGASGKQLGYAIGHQVGSDFRRSGAPLDPDAVVAGVRDALDGRTPRWTPVEMRDALRRLEESRAARSTNSP